MNLSEFKIEKAFWCGSRKWLCTDIGTRVITAIELICDEDPRKYFGPIYEVPEWVFDTEDMEHCTSEALSPEAELVWTNRKATKNEMEPMSIEEIARDTESMKRARASISLIPEPIGMEHSDFAIGDIFLCGVKLWRCYDIGTRVIVADVLCRCDDEEDVIIAEEPGPQHRRKMVFDEFDIGGCSAIYVIDEEVAEWLHAKGEGSISSKFTQALKSAMRLES